MSEIASYTPTTPSPNAVKNVSVSASPMSRQITSQRRVSVEVRDGAIWLVA